MREGRGAVRGVKRGGGGYGEGEKERERERERERGFFFRFFSIPFLTILFFSLGLFLLVFLRLPLVSSAPSLPPQESGKRLPQGISRRAPEGLGRREQPQRVFRRVPPPGLVGCSPLCSSFFPKAAAGAPLAERVRPAVPAPPRRRDRGPTAGARDRGGEEESFLPFLPFWGEENRNTSSSAAVSLQSGSRSRSTQRQSPPLPPPLSSRQKARPPVSPATSPTTATTAAEEEEGEEGEGERSLLPGGHRGQRRARHRPVGRRVAQQQRRRGRRWASQLDEDLWAPELDVGDRGHAPVPLVALSAASASAASAPAASVAPSASVSSLLPLRSDVDRQDPLGSIGELLAHRRGPEADPGADLDPRRRKKEERRRVRRGV